MDKMDLQLKGFKCFVDNCISLNKLTLLTGANASGKSSVIQSLLLLRSASGAKGQQSELNLENPRYAFDFGNSDSLINNESLSDEVTITIGNGAGIHFSGGEQKQNRKLCVHVDHLDVLKETFSSGLNYLCAERQGPRFEHPKTSDGNDFLDCHGINSGNVISENWNTKVSGKRLFHAAREESLFNIALDNWINYMFPGISVRIFHVGVQSYQVIVRDKTHNIQTDSTNIGFGISYALPIVVAGLLAKEDSWLVVENPEAHLHAKAQSNMGYFLGIMASAGLRVLVETHSEHVVNGIRRAAILSGRLMSDDVNIYFFSGKSENIMISIDDAGNLSDFPVDFFDQSRQDILEIIHNSNKNGEDKR